LFAGYFGSFIDVTEAQKMDAIGKLTGGVAA
jgi:hypothetical protein